MMTLEQAEASLALWQSCLDRIAEEGQEVQIGKVRFSYKDIDKVRAMVEYYQGEVNRLLRNGKPGAKIMRIIPISEL